MRLHRSSHLRGTALIQGSAFPELEKSYSSSCRTATGWTQAAAHHTVYRLLQPSVAVLAGFDTPGYVRRSHVWLAAVLRLAGIRIMRVRLTASSRSIPSSAQLRGVQATVTANAHSGVRSSSAIAVEQHEGAAKRGAIKNEVTPEQKQSHNEFVFLLLFWFLFVFLFVFLFLKDARKNIESSELANMPLSQI